MKIYIDSQNGDDQNSGRSDAPWKRLDDLVAKLKTLRAKHPFPDPIEVILADGHYPLAAPLVFDDPSLGAVTLRAANPGKATISGGRVLGGFVEETVNGQRVWKLQLPEVAARRWYFRQLFVDGVRRPRARYPKFDPVAKRFELSRLSEIDSQGKALTEIPLHDGDHRFKTALKPGMERAAWRQAEAVLLHFWVDERMPDLFLNPNDGWLESSHKSVFNLREAFDTNLARVYIDNLSTELTEPGEWFLDQDSGLLRYLPKEGEELGQVQLIAPGLKQFVLIHGKPHQGQYVEHIRLEGLRFEYADWCRVGSQKERHDQPDIVERPFPTAVQNATHLKGAISIKGARSIELTDCSITKVGFFAIGVEAASEKVKIHRCEMRDLGGGGVKITGEDAYGAEWTETKEVTVSDCEIHGGGKVFHTAPGIVIQHAAHNRIEHNHISDFFNTGIACGSVWSYEKTRSFENRIVGNHIHHLGQGLLNDMGGIYILGTQQGTLVCDNWIHHIEAENYGAHGIYLDESCSYVAVEGNVVHHVDGVCLILHRGRENNFRNNLLAYGKHALIELSNVDDFRGFTAMRNILITDGKSPAVLGGYACDIFKSRSIFEANLYYSDKGQSMFGNVRFNQSPHYEGKPLSEWRRAGYDCLSIEADPEVEGFGTVDLRLNADSPARRLGFVDIDLHQTGPRAEDVKAEDTTHTSSEEMRFG